ncbi:MAG: ATP-binding protein [Gemmatimonadetes bacterium]|nr:ATP-binding protein [Gemmatimonadota bacterium]
MTANFRVDPRLTTLLGETYRSSEQALKELVDNAWDADASTVDVLLPAAMSADPVVIRDDGSGMTEVEVRSEYLAIANDRRSRKGEKTHQRQRRVKGRKGIGKFAGLMVADVMNIETIARGVRTMLVIQKQDLLRPDHDLEQIDLPINTEVADTEAHGTTITLTSLAQHLAFPTPERLRRFSVQE